MRFYNNYRPPTIHQLRSITKFLWFPKTINYETRWLETATWTEKYYGPDHGGWYAENWVLND